MLLELRAHSPPLAASTVRGVAAYSVEFINLFAAPIESCTPPLEISAQHLQQFSDRQEGPQTAEERGAGPHLFLSKKIVISHQAASYSAAQGVFTGVMHNHRLWLG